MDDSIRAAASKLDIDVDEWRAFYSERVKSHKALVRGYIAFLEDMHAKNLPPIFEGRHLSLLLGLSPTQLSRYTYDPDSCYRTFEIPKKSGGHRSVSVPWLNLLVSQQWLDWNIFRKLPVHDAAHGFVQGRSNISNAAAHLGAKRILTVDVRNFFGSIGEHKILDIALRVGYPPNVAFLISRLCSRLGSLPQGAPSSPQISNVAMYDCDEYMFALFRGRGITYTRYVDDITLSGDNVSLGCVADIDKALSMIGLELNSSKTRLQVGEKKIVTGVSIGTGSLKLPRKMKRAFKNAAFIALKQIGDGDEIVIDSDAKNYDRQIGRLAYWLQVEKDNVSARSMFERLKGRLDD